MPCVDHCVPGSNVVVILEKVEFENSSHDGVVITFLFITQEASICSSIDVNVLKIESPEPINNDIQGNIFSINSLNKGQTELKAKFSFVPFYDTSYRLSLVLSCQINMPMFYQKQILVFGAMSALYFHEPFYASPTIGSPLGMPVSFIILIFTFVHICICWWLVQPSPFGVLTSIPKIRRQKRWEEEEETSTIMLGRGLGAERSLLRKLISKSIVSCEELELASKGHLNFYGVKFDLVFKRGRQVYIRVRRGYASSIRLRRHSKISMNRHRQEHLLDGDIINIGGKDIAVFSISKVGDF
jgi:hypothetical protein